MFGYIKPDSKELKVKEYELYKSTYCGLCRVMGKRYSFIYKMSLSYDFVFMVLLRLLISSEKVSFSKKRCIAHPTKKKVMMEENEALRVASDVGVIMLYHDFLDKIHDKDGIKSLFCKIFLPELKRLRKRACNKNESILEFDRKVSQGLQKLSEYEEDIIQSVDMPAEQFGQILGCALSLGLGGADEKIIFELGKSIGKWIYITDALDDIDNDEKKNKYNPFLAVYGSANEAKKHGDTISVSLLSELDRAYKAFILLDCNDKGVYNIIDNIIRIGNINTQEEILKRNCFLNNIDQKEE